MNAKRLHYADGFTGFTLIELLVVISIIALLLSVLMPALSKAKMAAQKVVCQSNLKQQSLACSLYMNDSKDIFPSQYTKPNSAPGDASASYWRWGGKNGVSAWTNQQDRFLNPYIGREQRVTVADRDSGLKVFSCPSDRGIPDWTSRWYSGDSSISLWDATGASYHYNSAAINNDGVSGLWFKKRSQVKRADVCVLAGDFTMTSFFNSSLVGKSPYFKAYWHNKRENGWANVVFVDGHVGFILMVQGEAFRDGLNYQNGTNWTLRFDGPKRQ